MVNFPHLRFSKAWQVDGNIGFLLGQAQALIWAISRIPIRPDYLAQLKRISMTKGAQATTAIEGNTLSLEQVEDILDKKRKISASREYLAVEVDNILAALQAIEVDVLQKKQTPVISPDLILKYHAMVGKNLGEHFEAVPGRFRNNNVIVGNYRAPDHRAVEKMIGQLCEWLKKEFHFTRGQEFSEAIIQAVVTHLYIAWIHPFSDGNGRTARLLEYYLLLRAGVPDIASHVMSNHYNLTRSDYYRQIEASTKSGDLTGFLFYALQGFRDGLKEVLEVVQENQRRITWQNYLFTLFEGKKLVGAAVASNKRQRNLSIAIPTEGSQPPDSIRMLNNKIFHLYEKENDRTLERDLAALVKLGVIEKTPNGYRGKIEILDAFMARDKNS